MATDTIVRVDPKTLLVGPNVRKEIDLPPEFTASIKEHGVKIPIVAHETPDGLEVVDGQMRTLAAVDAGLAEVPVFVRPAVAEGERTVDQLVVNRERTSLSRADEVAAVKQLALDFKMPAADVAKKVGIPREQVDLAVKVAKSEPATRALEFDLVSLEQAAKLADHPELSKAEVKQVLDNARIFDHQLQGILDKRAEAALTQDLERDAKAAGIKLVVRPKPEYSSEPANKHRYLEDLVDGAGKKITPAEHEACEGHAAYVGKKGGYNYNEKVELRLLCTDPAKYGHRDGRRNAKAPMSDAEKSQRKIEIERGKQWEPATAVRRAWIREHLLTRKVAPAAWEQLVARVEVGIVGHAEASFQYGDLAHDLLDVKRNGYGLAAIVSIVDKTPTRSAIVLLALFLAKVEYSLRDRGGWQAASALYLETLASWGYGLSDLEAELVAASKKARAKK
jgi:ParB family chromosome partitioning protein